MTRTGAQAEQWLRTHRNPSDSPYNTWHRFCLASVRLAFGVLYMPDSAWPADRRDAGFAWAHAQHRHRTSDPMSIPKWVPVYLDTSGETNHVVFSIGNGRCLTVDFKRDGFIDEADIADIARAWGPLQGWAEDLVGNRIWTPPAPTQGLSVDMVDVSHHQTQDFDYRQGRKAGVKAIIHKATEGATFVDPAYGRRRAEVSGVIARLRRRPRFGGYHFGRPSGGDAIEEARHFLETARIKRGDIGGVLDLEVTGGLSMSQLDTWALTWGQTVKAEVSKVGLYTRFRLPRSEAFYDFVWRARYNDDNRPPDAPWDIFQFSNGVLGVPDSAPGYGHVDLNHFRNGLTIADLRIPRRKKRPAVKKPPITIEHAHTSGRFDASPAPLEILLDDLMTRTTLITGTEVAREVRAKKLNEKHWAHFRGPNKPGADENFIAWPTASVERIDVASIQVTDLTYFTTTGEPTAPVHITIGAFRHIPTGRVTVVSVGHYPSDVEGKGGPEGIWNLAVQRRIDAHKSATKGTSRVVHQWAVEHGAEQVLIFGDWNVDIKRARIRQWFADQFPGMTPTVPETYDGPGDLGDRVVSFGLTRGLAVTGGPVFTPTPASDHGYSVETLFGQS